MRRIKQLFYLLYKLYFIIVFTVLFALLYPFFKLGFYVIKNNQYTYFLHRLWSFTLHLLTFIFLKKTNYNKNLPKEPFIIIANHTSFLDVFLMFKMFPKNPFIFMAKAELASIPLFGMLFRHFHIPVHRKNIRKAAEAVVKGKKTLSDGMCLAIFPEGGIIDGYAPKVAPFKNGAFELAISEKVGIVLVTFMNNFRIIGDTSKLLSVARPAIAEAIIHPYIDKDEVQKMTVLELKQKCFEIIEKPLKDKYGF